LFCLVDDVYQNITPNAQRYESLKKLSDSEVITLDLFQQLRGIESQRSFLRAASRFFSHLFPGMLGLVPSSLHPRQIGQSASFVGAAWAGWGSFSVYGMKLHLLCATNGVPLSYELTSANVTEVRLTEELLAEDDLGREVVRTVLGDLAYRSSP
jgi:hypothetical protein